MPNLTQGLPGFEPKLISRARQVAKAHGCRMLKPTGRMSMHEWGLGCYRLVAANGDIVAGRRHELTPADVLRHFGEAL